MTIKFSDLVQTKSGEESGAKTFGIVTEINGNMAVVRSMNGDKEIIPIDNLIRQDE